MSFYRLEFDALDFVVTKDGEVAWRGSLKPNLSTYGYTAQDSSGNNYALRAKGFFWWRKIELYMNSVLLECFALYRSKTTGMQIDRRQRLLNRHGDLVCWIENDRTETENGVSRFKWDCTEETVLPQAVTMLVMKYQGRGQPMGI